MSAAGRARVLLLATCDTKGELAAYLLDRLRDLRLDVELIDISLTAGGGKTSDGKLAAMRQAATAAAAQIERHAADGGLAAVVALGGATGVQIFAQACLDLPAEVRKVVVTTTTSDLRRLFAGERVTTLLSAVDLFGINELLRGVMDDAATMVAALCERRAKSRPAVAATAVAVSALGVTQGAAEAIYATLDEAGAETTMFHASYHSGRALARWVAAGSCAGLLDATTHELTSLVLDQQSPVPAERFCLSQGLPRVTMPGAANVRTLGPMASLHPEQLAGDYYQHSGEFTHVALSDDQMEQAGAYLGEQLRQVSAQQLVVLPMGGFSSEDRPGGAVENATGREAFAQALQAALAGQVEIVARSEHINDPALGRFAAQRLLAML